MPVIARKEMVVLVVGFSFFCLSADHPATKGSTIFPRDLYVDAEKGAPEAAGTREAPLKRLGEAIERLPEEILDPVTIHLAPGTYREIAADGAVARRFGLMRRMGVNGLVCIRGEERSSSRPAAPGAVVIDWDPTPTGSMIPVTEGRWSIQNVQVGTRRKTQQCGLLVVGPALLELRDVQIRTGGRKASGLLVDRAGRVQLYGRIDLNGDLHERAKKGSSSHLTATGHATVRFEDPTGMLSIGNGGLHASRYGVIRLSCGEARVTSQEGGSGCIQVVRSGRVDLYGTTATLCAEASSAVPILVGHDGHVYTEKARILIEGRGNARAILVRRCGTFRCGKITIRGKAKTAVRAESGGNFTGGFLGDLGRVEATGGAVVTVERCEGALTGPFDVERLGEVFLPSGRAVR